MEEPSIGADQPTVEQGGFSRLVPAACSTQQPQCPDKPRWMPIFYKVPKSPQSASTESFPFPDHTHRVQGRNQSSFSHFPRSRPALQGVSAWGIHPVPAPSTMKSSTSTLRHGEVTAPITLPSRAGSPPLALLLLFRRTIKL